MFSDETIKALARLREASRTGMGWDDRARTDFNELDNAGIFADLDEQTDFEAAQEILSESAQAGLEARFPNTADPAEWGDTTSADMARHQGYVPALERVGRLEYPTATPELDASDRAAEGRLGRRALGLD